MDKLLTTGQFGTVGTAGFMVAETIDHAHPVETALTVVVAFVVNYILDRLKKRFQ